MNTAAVSTPLKMRDLQSQTGVSRQAIHFYLREGLLPEPERPKHNVAYYNAEHVVRIQAIKRLQKDRALSLSDIKALLDNFDYSAHADGDDLANFELALHARVDGDLPGADQSLEQVAAKTGLSLAALSELDKAGAISIKHEDGCAVLDFRDAGIVERWAKLLALGFGDKPEYDADFLGRYAQALQPVADQVVDTFFSAFDGELNSEAVELAAQGIAATNELITRLHTQALMQAIANRSQRHQD